MASRAPGLTEAAAAVEAPALRAPRRGFGGGGNALPFRILVTLLLGIGVLSPVGLIAYQSFLSGPFFDATSTLGLEAWGYVLTDPDFWDALTTTALFSLGMTAIAVPLGAGLAFLLTRTDVRGRRWIEPLVLVPMFLSSIVLAFGYTVSVGPSGFLSLWVEAWFGFVPWNIYGLGGLIVIGGLSHVPNVYLYAASAMRSLPADLEEAARTAGASLWRVAWEITLPLTLPALVFAIALNLLLGFESFGLPLVLGDPGGLLVLTTYIYKLTTLFGLPTYHLMAVVAVILVALTLPLVWVQRKLLGRSRRFATLGGKGARATPLRLGRSGQILALSAIGLWFFVSVVLPAGGIALRAFVDAWGQGVNIGEHLTLANFQQLLVVPSLTRGLINSVLIAAIGGAVAVCVYLLVALAAHRWSGMGAMVLDYMVLLPRALPGLVIGLAFFWLFLFVPFLTPLRPTLFSVLIAYIVVGLAYGLRLIQATLLQVAPELEESARTTGATIGQTWTKILAPLLRPGLVGAWTLIMIVFLREYATGVYLLSAGTEVIGSLIVSLLATGAMDVIAALSFVSVVLTAIGMSLALRLGAKMHG
jgi:iron(III) transport system permease protein